MSTDARFAELCHDLDALRGALRAVRHAVLDRPLDGDVVLVDLFADATDDALGWLEEACDAAAEASEASADPEQLAITRARLVECQESAQRVVAHCASDLMRYDRLADLARCGRERGGEWRTWADHVKRALDASERPLFEVNQALFRCWQELAAHLPPGRESHTWSRATAN